MQMNYMHFATNIFMVFCGHCGFLLPCCDLVTFI